MERSSSRRVLVVDPDPSVRTLMHAFLKRRGYTVDIAADSNAALTLRKLSDHVAVILEPRTLGGMSLLRELYAVDRRGRSSFVIVTTPDNSMPDFAHAPGVRRVLYKPFDIEALADAVGHCCDDDVS